MSSSDSPIRGEWRLQETQLAQAGDFTADMAFGTIVKFAARHPARFWFVESLHSFSGWHLVHNSARILHGLCAFCKTSEQPPTRIGKNFRRRNATRPKQSHHFARLAQMDGRTIPVPREPDRIQPSDGVVIQDRRDGGTVTEPNIIQQTNLWLAFASHYARSGAALWRESCGGQGRA